MIVYLIQIDIYIYVIYFVITYFIIRDILIIIYIFYYLYKKLSKMNGQTKGLKLKKQKNWAHEL